MPMFDVKIEATIGYEIEGIEADSEDDAISTAIGFMDDEHEVYTETHSVEVTRWDEED